MRLRLGVLLVLAAGLFAPPPTLAAQLDRAVALLEQDTVAVEQRPAQPPATTVSELIAAFETRVVAAEQTARDRLDAAWSALTTARCDDVTACIDHHLSAARCELARAEDPPVQAEYRSTCAVLVALRARIVRT
jgi:hypothetical protein